MVVTEPADVPPHLRLRAILAEKHAQVDAAFGGFDLADREGYGAFLAAHARVLPPIEQALRPVAELPAFEPRAGALTSDLAALGISPPSPAPAPSPASVSEAWGMFYVIEGSRLGGGMLARMVPDAFPKAYLGAVHQRGGWRALCQALDEAVAAGGEGYMDAIVVGARATFDRYAAAAREQG